MTRVYVTGLGIVSPAGHGCAATLELLRAGASAIRPLDLFGSGAREPLPAGQVPDFAVDEGWPRTHALALAAAKEALSGAAEPFDALVLGGTTGGMPLTEVLLREGDQEAEHYRLHGLGTVADHVAAELGCTGPIFTISTACSSGAAALKIGLELLRAGRARRVLAGGADGLCRLTYHGFSSLKLIDPQGARPLCAGRAGMTVGEAAAMLLLEAADDDAPPPAGAVAELLGGALSCDAHHASAPHPEGRGAIAAMSGALADAQIAAASVDYVNLHGTGTIDNDAAEARALRALFGQALPPLSSTKGAFSHTLAASGAVEAVIAVLALQHGLLPANVGCRAPDGELGLADAVVLEPRPAPLEVALSNSFGFGGNNASVVLGRVGIARGPDSSRALDRAARRLEVLGYACVTGAGHTDASMARLLQGQPVSGLLDDGALTEGLPRRALRRLKRQSWLTLALAARASGGPELPDDIDEASRPGSVYLGTSWGALSETHDFLDKLFESNEEFSSPTDFVGSVHNAVAGQVAIRYGATGPNVTASGGDASFDQALQLAALLAEAGPAAPPVLLLGVDEHQPRLTPLLDASVRRAAAPADGGGALLVRPLPVEEARGASGPYLRPLSYQSGRRNEAGVTALLEALGGPEGLRGSCAAVLLGVPAAERRPADRQLEQLLALSGFSGPVIDYRRLTGEYAAAAATAAVLAVKLVEGQVVPAALAGTDTDLPLQGRGILLLGLGQKITATEVGQARGGEQAHRR